MRLFSVVAIVLAAICAVVSLPACKYHPGSPGEDGVPSAPTVTPEDIAARIRSVADAVGRIYPDRPEIAAVAAAISSAAGFVETGDLQAAGRALVALASTWPAYREYALLASVALELLSPGPAVGAKALVSETWCDCVKKAAPDGASVPGAAMKVELKNLPK